MKAFNTDYLLRRIHSTHALLLFTECCPRGCCIKRCHLRLAVSTTPTFQSSFIFTLVLRHKAKVKVSFCRDKKGKRKTRTILQCISSEKAKVRKNKIYTEKWKRQLQRLIDIERIGACATLPGWNNHFLILYQDLHEPKAVGVGVGGAGGSNTSN